MARAFDDVRPPEPDLIEDCVHCGFCLPSCPTYVLWGEEANSPRGRIVLMRAGHDSAELSVSQVDAWDNCLGCMACVTACPSGVQYDKLIEDTRAQVERRFARPRLERLKRRAPFLLFPYPARLRAVAPFSPLARLVPRLGRLAPRVSPREALRRLPERTPARGTRRGRVGFLQGCVQRVFFGNVNRATVAVLAAEGFDVYAPASPGCCGALELHTGWADPARERARRMIAAFEGCETVVVNAAGCGSAMKDYGHVLRDDPAWAERAAAFAARVRDVTEFLCEYEPVAERRPLDLKVAYHDACHLAHAQGVREQPRALLRAIPGVEVCEPAEWELCCGSAGVYNMLKPGPAAELGERKARNLLDTGATAVAAANPGCAVQIAAYADLPVYHPMEILHASLTGRRLSQ
jgi:glycolate oxidase iron-sulfur subunit